MNSSINKRVSAIVFGALTAVALVGRRSMAHWKMLAYVLVGVVLACTILAGMVVYFDALRELALKNSLAHRSSTDLDIKIRVNRGPTSIEEYEKVLPVVEHRIANHAQWMLLDQIAGGKSPTFSLVDPGNEEAAWEGIDRAFFTFVPKLNNYMAITDGRAPGDGSSVPRGTPLLLEALVPAEVAREFGVDIGSVFSAVPYGTSEIPFVGVTITGLIQDRLSSVEWDFYTDEILRSRSRTSDLRTMPFYITQDAYLNALGPSMGRMNSTYLWLLDTDINRINADNSRLTLANLQVMARGGSAQLQAYTQTSRLNAVLTDFDRRLFFSKLPMFVVLILIALVILYYVMTMSSLVVENQRSEVALFRSRGSDTSHVLTVFVLEGIVIALIAVIVAPILAVTTISLLGLTPAFNDLTGGALLSARLTPGAYGLSFAGGLISFVALMLPAIQASRFGVTQQRQQASRPSLLPTFQRYYLDVLLLLVSMFLFRQLTEQGSVVARDVFGSETADVLLLAVPGLALIASAMVLLRLFPLVMKVVSVISSRWMPVWSVVTVWQMSREPTHYALLSLLLILTAGLGIFASSFGTTLERSFQERISYLTGSDVRLTTVRYTGDRDGPNSKQPEGHLVAEDAFSQVSGVEVVSSVYRHPGRDVTKAEGGGFELIAVNAANFTDVAWFREDFANEDISKLFAKLTGTPFETSIGLPIADDADSLYAVARTDRLKPTTALTIKLRNSISQRLPLRLGFFENSEMSLYEAPLHRDRSPDFFSHEPIVIESIAVEEVFLGRRLDQGTLLVDEIGTKSAAGIKQILEPFDEIDRWDILKSTDQSLTDELHDSLAVLDVDGLAIFSWKQGDPLTPRGIFFGHEPEPIPVLASVGFLQKEARQVHDSFEAMIDQTRVPIKIVGEIELFPSNLSDRAKYLVADIAGVNAFAVSSSSVKPFVPNEIWLSSDTSGQERIDLLSKLKDVNGFNVITVLDREERFRANDAYVDPLVDAGWRALLFIAFSSVLLLSCLGFLVHIYSSFRSRQIQFALMRTLGLSGKQLVVMMWLEQTLVIAVGLLLGTWMGGRLGATIIPFLGHNDFGGKVVPPFVMQIDWESLGFIYLAMLVVFAIITAGLILIIQRISLSGVLRLGEQA